jgi:glycosyltransferase involved in cell wall biosynthesis
VKLLLACEDFRVGGAQIFVLRLAQAFSSHHKVYLYSHYHDYIAEGMVKRLAPNIEVITCQIPYPLDWVIRKVDRLFYKLRVDFSIREQLIASHLLQIVKKHKIDVVHSNMFKSDLVVVKALQASGVPVVVTVHGDYESFLATYLREKVGEYIHQYRRKVLHILDQAKAIVYLTAKNLRVFDVYKEGEKYRINGLIVRKIYNGFAAVPSLEHTHICRERLGISTQALVFGMVARGIPEKGWQEAIQAFLLLVKDTSVISHLILVGESDYLTEL